MPRAARKELAGGVHHVTTRGNERRAVFRDAGDRHTFVRLLRRTSSQFGWRLLTYCLMPNHYHLLVLTPEPTLGAGMHRLNGQYAQRFNARHARSGRLWEDRFHNVVLRSDAHLLQVARYVALNPVRAGLCTHPDEWQWGGHRALAGLASPGGVAIEEALSRFGADGGDGRSRYVRFVADPET